MEKKISELEDQLQEIIESNKQIKAISSVLNENWEGLSSLTRRDQNEQLIHYEVSRVSERNETLFHMLTLLTKDIEEKNSKVLDDITKMRRELV